MLSFRNGNLLDTPDRYIAHGCNAFGVMGSGVALAVRQKWPEAYEAYIDTYEKTGLEIGTFNFAEVNDKVIFNCITQVSFGRDPKERYVSYDAIDKSIRGVCDMIRTMHADKYERNLSIPMIGSGLGNGNWNVIQPILLQHSTETSTRITIWQL